MKKQLWNKVTSVALSLAMAVTLIPTPVSVVADEAESTITAGSYCFAAVNPTVSQEASNDNGWTGAESMGNWADTESDLVTNWFTAENWGSDEAVDIQGYQEVTLPAGNYTLSYSIQSAEGEGLSTSPYINGAIITDEAKVATTTKTSYTYTFDTEAVTGKFGVNANAPKSTKAYVGDISLKCNSVVEVDNPDDPIEEPVVNKKGFDAFLMFADSAWGYDNWGADGYPEGNAVVKGDGTYTVSLSKEDATATGATVFNVDINGAAKAIGAASTGLELTTSAEKKALLNDKEVFVTGVKVLADGEVFYEFADEDLIYGDIEGNGNIRIEIFNAYGESGSNEELAAKFAELAVNEKLEVEFTIEGFEKLLPPSYDAFLMFADSAWGYDNWDADGYPEGNADVTGDGTYTVSLSKEDATATGATVFNVDINRLALAIGAGSAGTEATTSAEKKALLNDKDVFITGVKVLADGEVFYEFADEDLIYGDIEGNGNVRIEIFNAYGETGANEELAAKFAELAVNEKLEVEFTIAGLDAIFGPSYDAFLMFADSAWGYDNWDADGYPEGNARVTGDGDYTVSLSKEDATATGATVFNVDIPKMAASVGAGSAGTEATTSAEKKALLNDKGVFVTGVKVFTDGELFYEFADEDLIYGDIEGNGNIRIEIFNAYGESGANEELAAKFAELAVNEKLEVKFTIAGFDEAIAKGKFYIVEVKTEGEGGSASANPSAAHVDDEITLSAVPYSGYEFKEWKSDDVEIVDGKFIMPAKDVVVYAVFEKKAEEVETPVDDSTVTAHPFGPYNITASNNVVLSSKDYTDNPLKAEIDFTLNKKVWNDWCPFYVEVQYDGKVKYYVFAGASVTWNVTVGRVSNDEDSDVYVVPVGGSLSVGEIAVDNYEIIKMEALKGDDTDVLDYSLVVKEIAGCKDWSITFYCPAWSADNTQTVEDPDGTTKDLLAEMTDEYDEEGNPTGNKVPLLTDESENYVYIAKGNVYTTTEEVEKVVEPDVAGPAKGKVISDKKYKYKVVVPGKTDGSVVGELQVTGLKKKSLKTIKIAAKVKIGGVTYEVTSIKKNAFKKNKKVTTVKIGKNVKTIGSNAFAKMKKLKKVYINSTKLTTIGNSAFAGDKKLTTVTIKSPKLKTIGKKAFYGDKKLKKVTVATRILKKVGKQAFKKTAKKISFKVPDIKKKDYKKLFKKAGASKKLKVKS